MKIALIGPSAPWRGGIAHYTSRLAHALADRGHAVESLNFRSLYPDLLFPGRRQIDDSQVAFDLDSRRLLAPLDPVSWVTTARAVIEAQPDRAVFQWWHPFFAPCYRAVAWGASAAGIDVVFQCHNVEPHESTIFDRALLTLAYSGADAFVVQSRPEKQRLTRLVGNRRPIEVAAHPPYDQFESSGRSASDWRAALDIESEHVLLFFGLVREYKGLDVLLEAMSSVGKQHDVTLVVAGEHYEDPRRYERQVQRLDIGDRVVIHDAYIANEDVAGLFDMSAACVLPYRRATGSGVANIAASRGVPLVMSALPDLQDAFGEAARWFEPGDASALARQIETVLDQPPGRQAHSTCASWDDVVETLTTKR